MVKITTTTAVATRESVGRCAGRPTLRLTLQPYLPITGHMRRKPGTLLPVEVAILAAALESGPGEEFYGYAIARRIQAGEGSRLLTAHGTLYKALDRMLRAGLLSERWEDAEAAAREERPRRRLYRVTGVGEAALHEEARRQALQHAAGLSEGLQPS